MKRKKFKLILVLLVLTPGLKAQELIQAGVRLVVYSHILNEERPYRVYLPESYNNSGRGKAKYPVLYLLDGEKNFFSQVAVHNALTNGMYRYMPEMIIVAIENTDRSRDLTPTRSQVIHNGKVLHASSGGAENFHHFLTGELRHTIDSAYRTNGYNLLSGHSFGGLFSIFCLFNHPSSFNAYIAHDPSLWWDNKVVYHTAIEKREQLNLEGTTLFVSIARSEEKENDREQHTQTIRDFCSHLLSSPQKNGLRGKWEYFENEDHGTILLPASYNAMKYIYDGICLPVKEIPFHPEFVSAHYRKVSSNLHFPVIPDEELLELTGNYCISVGQLDAAKTLFETNLYYYPLSPAANANMKKIGQHPDKLKK